MKTRTLPSHLEHHPIPTLLLDEAWSEIVSSNRAADQLLAPGKSLTGVSVAEVFKPFKFQVDSNSVVTTTIGGRQVSLNAQANCMDFDDQQLNLIFLFPGPANGNLQSAFAKIVHDNTNEILLVSDDDHSIIYANLRALSNLGYSDVDLGRLKLTDLFTFPDEMALNALLNTLRGASTDKLQLQMKFSRKDGSHYDVEVFIRFLPEQRLFTFVASDISARLVTEKKLLETIREKDTLIKEIHHRVKNNLQLISSIIYLKLISLQESEMRSFLEDTRQKIRSIALIHERLLQSEKLDRVDISDYLGKLIHDLEITYHRPDLDLKIQTELEHKLIGLDTAIICGLIVNELVTNSIKHAFTGRSRGSIVISLVHGGTDAVSLTVADDGTSLPEGAEPGKATSFGMQLIHVFVQQLNGKLLIHREKGTKFQLIF